MIDVRPVYLCDAVRTPFGRYAGVLSGVRTDDLAAIPIAALRDRNAGVDWQRLDDVVFGCANQAGEDNRNVGRMALLLAGLPQEVPGSTVNRLCGSSMDAVATVARAIAAGEMELVVAGGVESMSRAPFVMNKGDAPFARGVTIEDTTLGWRFVNPRMEQAYGTHSMAETAENVAAEWKVSRADQDAFALRSQQRAGAAIAAGRFDDEIVPVTVPQRKGPVTVSADEHPRPDTTLEALTRLKPIVRPDGTVTAGNASGINDGACAMLLASEEAVRTHRLTPQGAVRGVGGRGGRSAGDGDRPRAGVAQGADPRRSDRGSARRHRTERSLRRAGPRRPARSRHRRRRGARQPERRRDRDRPSPGRQRRPAGDHRDVSAGTDQGALRALHDVHRGRAGDSGGD